MHRRVHAQAISIRRLRRTANKYDGLYNWSGSLHIYLPYMRLGDIYTMYAEACGAVDGAKGKASNFTKTAEDAINTLRDRVGEGHVNSKYTANKNKFIDEVRRSVPPNLYSKVSLQRLATLAVAHRKALHREDITGIYVWSRKTISPVAKAIRCPDIWMDGEDYPDTQLRTKHYWFPLKVTDTSMYPEFKKTQVGKQLIVNS